MAFLKHQIANVGTATWANKEYWCADQLFGGQLVVIFRGNKAAHVGGGCGEFTVLTLKKNVGKLHKTTCMFCTGHCMLVCPCMSCRLHLEPPTPLQLNMISMGAYL